MIWVLAWLITAPTRRHGQKRPVWGLREGKESQMDVSYAESFAVKASRAVSHQYCCLFTPHWSNPRTSDCSNKPHVWVIMPLFSGSWSQECFLQLFPWGVKFSQESGVLKDGCASSANAVASTPPVSFTCYYTAFSPGRFGLLHHMSPGYNPHRTRGMVSHRAGEIALQKCLKKILALEKKYVNLWITSTIVP